MSETLEDVVLSMFHPYADPARMPYQAQRMWVHNCLLDLPKGLTRGEQYNWVYRHVCMRFWWETHGS